MRRKNRSFYIKRMLFLLIIAFFMITIIYFTFHKDTLINNTKVSDASSNTQNNDSNHNNSRSDSNNISNNQESTTSTDRNNNSNLDHDLNDTTDTMEVLSRDSVNNLPATTILNYSAIDLNHLEYYFYSDPINDSIYSRILGISYPSDKSYDINNLRYLRVLYYGFDDERHIGELIVHKDIVTDMLEIMKELYISEYPIERMVLIDSYEGNDESSMEDNNTSSFNYRVIAGSKKLSKHSEGLAIDINPLYNPYVKTIDNKTIISPVNGSLYVDRSLDSPYLIKKGDICYNAFTNRGFTWGGDWNSLKDYQHFEKSLENSKNTD